MSPSLISRLGVCFTLLALILTATPASAQTTTYTWTGATDALWSTAGNWSSTANTQPASDLTNTLLVLTGSTQTTNTLDYDFSANSLTFDAGAGAFTIGGTNTLTLGTGGITVAGTNNQIFNANLALGAASTWANNSTGTFTVGGTVNNGGNLLTVGGSGNSTYSGIISGTGGLTKSGGGTVTLSGANTYTGVTTINSAVLSVSTLADGGAASGIGASSNIADNLVLNGGTLQYTGAAVSTDRLFTLGTSGGAIDAIGTGAVNFANTGNVAFNGSGNRTLTLTGTNTGTNTLAAALGNGTGGATSLTKSGAGTWILSGASTYTGATTINNGTLRAGANSVFAPNSAYSLATTAGVLDLNGTTQTIGSLSGGGSTGGNVSLGSGTLTLGGTNASTTFSGLFQGTGTVTKVGTGTLTLRGNSTWTGPLNVLDGIVSIDTTTRLNSTASGLVTLNGGTLQQTNPGNGGSFISQNRGIAIGSNGGTVEVTTAGIASLYRGTITGTGNTLAKSGLGEFRYEGTGTASSTYTRLLVNQGLFRIGAGVAGSTEVGFGAVPASPLADAITLNGGAIGSSLSLTLNANRGITLGTNGGTINNGSAPFSIPSIITGNGSLTVSGGTQLVTLSGANNYTGITTISTGTVAAGASNTLSASSAVTVASGAVLNLANFNQTVASLAGAGNVTLGSAILTAGGNNTSTTYSGVMSGSGGGLSKQGTGAMLLTGVNTYTGTTAVNAGTLGGSGSIAGAATVAGGARVLGGNGTATGQTFAIGGNLTTANTGGIKTVVGNGGTFNDTTTTGSSLVAVTGTFNRDATTSLINIDLMSDGSAFTLDTTYTRRVLTYGTLGSNLTAQSYTNGDGVFALNAFGFTISSGWQVLVGDGGNWVDVQFTPVPEPATVMGVAVAGLGLVGLVRRRLRRREVSLAA